MRIESFTLTDTGNLGTGGYARTIEGNGFYERTSTGDGATQPSDTGAIDYLFAQSADPHSGTFTASWTGTTRYDLLEGFHDISNTQPGRSPGHMNFYPFGQPFVDPNRPIGGIGMMPPGGWPADWSPEWEAGQRSDRESALIIMGMMGGAAGASRALPFIGRGAIQAGATFKAYFLPFGGPAAALATRQRLIDRIHAAQQQGDFSTAAFLARILERFEAEVLNMYPNLFR